MLCIMLFQFKFSTSSERALMICAILLSAWNSLMIPILMVILGMALQHFADHYNTAEYFNCIHDGHINCSAVQYCPTTSNGTDCCMSDSAKCVTNDLLLQRMDILTVLCAVITIVMLASSWMHASIFHYTGSSQMLRIRKRLFQSLVNQDIKWFDVNDSKEITSRMIE